MHVCVCVCWLYLLVSTTTNNCRSCVAVPCMHAYLTNHAAACWLRGWRHLLYGCMREDGQLSTYYTCEPNGLPGCPAAILANLVLWLWRWLLLLLLLLIPLFHPFSRIGEKPANVEKKRNHTLERGKVKFRLIAWKIGWRKKQEELETDLVSRMSEPLAAGTAARSIWLRNARNSLLLL